MNNLGRGSTRRCYIPNIKALRLLVSEKKIFKDFAILSFWLPWQPDLWLEFNLFSNFGRASHKEHPCQVSSSLAPWFRRRCLKKLWTTDDARWTTDIG